MNMNMKQCIIILAMALVLCLAPMPYGYFVLVRYVATILFLVMAYNYYMDGNKLVAYFWIALAILFQPIFKIALGRTMWNIIDIVVSILLLFALWKRKMGRTD